MFRVSTSCFLQVVTPSGQKILKAGKVIERDEKTVTVQFEEAVAPQMEEDVLLFGEKNRKFFQHSATICGLRIEMTPPAYVFQLVGEPVSAEQRGSYRVSLVTANLSARVGKGKCLLADVSPEGLAAISTLPLKVGQRVEVEFSAEGVSFYGQLSVQTAKQLTPTRFRYGLYAPEPKSVMRRSLERLAGTMQRYQLKRLSGAA